MHNKLIAAALAAGALAGLAPVVNAAPAVVAGTPYGPSGYNQPAPVYQGQQVYQGQPVYVQPAPPAPMYETVPAPRQGYIWSPGHYSWDNGRYVWRGGEWIAARPGHAWQAARWEQRADGSWQLVSGHWVATNTYSYDSRNGLRGPDGDLDGDGIRNSDDRDRDGDGIANRNDDFPNNPNRS